MTDKKTIAVFNNTSRLITLKGQIFAGKEEKEKEEKENFISLPSGRIPKRFSDRLAPKELTFISAAFWTIYKRSRVVQAMLDNEHLLLNKKIRAQDEIKVPLSSEEITKAAAVNAVEASLSEEKG